MYLVFTDLDGTLLDHFTYSYEKALPGMGILKKKGIPLVLVSSKTKPEMEALHRELELDSPFIFENGGGIAHYNKKALKKDKFAVEFTGLKINELLENLEMLKKLIPCPIKTINELEISELVEKTGLSEKMAGFSKMRKASLPFILTEDIKVGIREIDAINDKLKRHGFSITKGGRFFHFTSKSAGKGNAVKKIIDFYGKEKGFNNIKSMAMGDSENDISMLKAVDAPYLIRKYDGSFIRTGIENIYVTGKTGPAGFSEAIKKEIG